MNSSKFNRNLLIDAREFIPGRLTGIGRVLQGLIPALAESDLFDLIHLAVFDPDHLPLEWKNLSKVRIKQMPPAFFRSEKILSAMSMQPGCFYISPYPKLPLFGCSCPAVHIIHDVLDLTHPSYRWRPKVVFDGWRLKKSLRQADLTWYASHWSQKETMAYAGFIGKNPRVRNSGLSDLFQVTDQNRRNDFLKHYSIKKGYILVLGNGRPHKNLGVLLQLQDRLTRPIVFAGVSRNNQQYWKSRFSVSKVIWLEHIPDQDLPDLIRNAFCLAQPSLMEGYGFPPLEAMACGIPAVVSDIPVLSETTGGNALRADPQDPHQWQAAFHFLENSVQYRIQAQKGLDWVDPLRGARSWQKHIDDLKELLS